MKTINYNVADTDCFNNIFEKVILKNIFVGFTGFYNKKEIYINLREPTNNKKMFLLVLNIDMSRDMYIFCLHKVKSISIKDQLKSNRV